MSNAKTMSQARQDSAARALLALQPQASEHQRLGVQCRHGHHLAAVYETGEGLVYAARTGPHSHGSKDFIDTGRSGSPGGGKFVDLLVAQSGVDDALPAWCDCGPCTLSRHDLTHSIRRGVRALRVG